MFWRHGRLAGRRARGVTGLWGTGGLVWVAVTAAAYLVAGLSVFRVLERITKIRGALAAY